MIGETVGNFEIVAQIGKGAMGAVYVALQKSVKTKVAIKVLAPDISKNATHVQRFFNEAVAVSQIHHSGIVKIYDVGTLREGQDDAQAYLVMEYLDGETLGARLKKRGRLPIAELADLGRQIASVLEATHAAGITHRDLKPENIFLVRDAELASGERVKILDFGIAKLVQPDATSPRLTSLHASSIGTPLYMSPEQWHSLAEVDWRTDAYALGCIAFELACGRPPFVGESMADICAKHLSEPPPVPSTLVPGLPRALDDLIGRLLAKEPAERPTIREAMGVFTELARDQGLALTTLPPTGRSPFAPVPAVKTVTHAEAPAARPSGRRLGVVLAIAALAIVGIAGAAVVMMRGGTEPAAGAPADATSVAVVTPEASVEIDAAAVAVADAGVAADAAVAAVVVVDAGVAVVPRDAGTPVRVTPPVTRPVRLATLLAPVRGTVPTAAKATTLDVCFDPAGRVDSVGPKTTPKGLAEQVMRLQFQPHLVKGVATPACGKLAIAAKPAPVGAKPDGTKPDGTKPDGPKPDGTKPDGTKPDGTKPDGTKPDGTKPGALGAGKINEVVQKNRIGLVRCGRGKLDASVRLKLAVEPDGHARLLSVANAGGSDPDFPSCLQAEIGKLPFPSSGRGGQAEVTLRFTKAPAPQGGDDNGMDYPP